MSRSAAQEVLTKENFIDNIKNKKFDTVNGHAHDGTDSKLLIAGSLPTHSIGQHTDVTRTVFFNTPTSYTGEYATSLGCGLDDTVDEKVNIFGQLPSDFVSVTSVKVIYAARDNVAAADFVLDITSQCGAVGEAYNTHSVGDTGNVISVVMNDAYNFRAFTTAAILADVDENDFINFYIKRDANHASDTLSGDVIISGVLVTYTASQ